MLQNSVWFVSLSNRQVTDLNLPRSIARIRDMVVCSFRRSGKVTLPTNLLTALSAVNRHTAYMDSIIDQCHASTTFRHSLCHLAAPTTNTSSSADSGTVAFARI